MAQGIVVSICIAAVAGAKMMEVDQAVAEAGRGLLGDRYCDGSGSFNQGKTGKRQVTLMNAMFFTGSGFMYEDSRRNLFTKGVELMDLMGKEFAVGEVVLRGLKYCDPCARPSKIAGISLSFREEFFDRGGLVAEILQGGTIRVGDRVTPPEKGY